MTDARLDAVYLAALVAGSPESRLDGAYLTVLVTNTSSVTATRATTWNVIATFVTEVMADGPLAHWRLGDASGATQATDSSGNGRHMTDLQNSPVFGVPGLLGSDTDTAVSLSSSAIIRMPAASWMVTSSFTVEIVVKTSGNGVAFCLDDFGGAPGQTRRRWAMWISAGKVLGQVYPTGSGSPGGSNVCTPASTGTVNDNVRHNLALVVDDTAKTAKIYIDGNLDGSGTYTGTLTGGAAAQNPLTIGSSYNNNYATGVFLPLTGVVDEALLYGSALSSTRIAAHVAAMGAITQVTATRATTWNVSAAPLVVQADWDASALVGYSDGQGVATWPDSSGNGWTASQSIGAGVYKTGQTAAGLAVVRFSGYRYTTSAPSTATAQSVFAVVRPSGSGARVIVGGGDSSQFVLRVDSSGKVEIMRGGVASVGTSAATLSTTDFTVITALVTTTTWAIRINGVADASGSGSYSWGTPNPVLGVRIIGAHGTGDLFNGDIGELKTYEQAVGGTDLTGVESALISKWLLAKVTATRATTWNVDAATTQVTQTKVTTWNVDALASVTATRATTWNVDAFAQVTSTRATTWNVDHLPQVTETKATTWNIDRRITATRATTWSVVAAVVQLEVPNPATVQVGAASAGLWSLYFPYPVAESGTQALDFSIVPTSPEESHPVVLEGDEMSNSLWMSFISSDPQTLTITLTTSFDAGIEVWTGEVGEAPDDLSLLAYGQDTIEVAIGDGQRILMRAHPLDEAETGSGSITWGVVSRAETGVVDLSIHVAEITETPGWLPIGVISATPEGDLEFELDGATALEPAVADEDGSLPETGLLLPLLTPGLHTITVTDVASGQTDAETFTVRLEPVPPETIPGNEPPTTGVVPDEVIHWVLEDPVPGGLGAYTFPINPQSMSSVHFAKTLRPEHTVHPSGSHVVWQGQPEPVNWDVQGRVRSEVFYDALVAYQSLNRRIYVIDHHQRAWICTFESVEFTKTGRPDDWNHSYRCKFLIVGGPVTLT